MTAGGGAGRPWLRRAGRLDAGGGETVLWSVAEGRRGRRWRSLRLDALGAVVADLLLETDPAGSWTRLELATAAGLLTLHPDPDGRRVHGNVVTERGVVALAYAWSSGHCLVVRGEPVAETVLGADRPEDGLSPALVVDAALAPVVVEAIRRPRRPKEGLPGPSWPLETGEG